MVYLLGQFLVLALVLPYALAANYLVGVGKDETTGQKGVGFDPSVINPAVGDVITFEFRSGQHSVVQSTFDNPCSGNGQFNSGVQIVSDSLAVDAPDLPTVQLTVNDTNPLWFFDDAGGECAKGGVLAVNPSQAQTAAAFKDNAAKAPIVSPAPGSSSQPIATATDSSSPSGGSTSVTPSKTPNSAAEGFKQNHSPLLASLFLVAGVALW